MHDTCIQTVRMYIHTNKQTNKQQMHACINTCMHTRVRIQIRMQSRRLCSPAHLGTWLLLGHGPAGFEQPGLVETSTVAGPFLGCC